MGAANFQCHSLLWKKEWCHAKWLRLFWRPWSVQCSRINIHKTVEFHVRNIRLKIHFRVFDDEILFVHSEESLDLPHSQFALSENGDNMSIYLVRMVEVSSLGFGARWPGLNPSSAVCQLSASEPWFTFLSPRTVGKFQQDSVCEVPQPVHRTCSIKGSWCYHHSTTVRTELELCLQVGW